MKNYTVGPSSWGKKLRHHFEHKEGKQYKFYLKLANPGITYHLGSISFPPSSCFFRPFLAIYPLLFITFISLFDFLLN